MSKDNLYKQLSAERKEMQDAGLMPEWYSTGGWQLFKEKYLYGTDSVKGQYTRIVKTAAKHLEKLGMQKEAEQQFFNLLWNGWLSPSTPVLANMGTDRGLPVSCSGGYIADSIHDKDDGVGFYQHNLESAALTKYGFGTSGYMGDIRERGSDISVGGKASGSQPVFKTLIQTMRDVCQGTARRGAWAGYIPLDHGDFDELVNWIKANPDDANIGWCVSKNLIQHMEEQNPEAIRRFKKSQAFKMVTGKGYYFKTDTVNEQNPPMYKDRGLEVVASNLCSEIALFSGMYEGELYTFTCVLSSMNLAKYDEWKDTEAVYWATLFLDCVAQEFIDKAENVCGLEAAVRFTKASRALGLGVCGFHTYLQEHMIPFESFEAHMWNNQVFAKIKAEATAASEWMAIKLGEPEWCKGYGVRNTHLLAVAPTKSTALIMGGVSEGINPDPAMAFSQTTSAGEVQRVNPPLLNLMKKKGVYSKKNIQEIIDANGSVQNVEWLTDEEKKVFKTAFEINQETVIRLASQRQRFICQAQSVNLFFSAEEDEAWISHIHRLAFLDKWLKSLYYTYTLTGVNASKGECEACQ